MAHRQHGDPHRAVDRLQLLVAGHRLRTLIAQDDRLRRAVDIGIDQPDLAPAPCQRNRQIGGQRRFADAALAAAHRNDPPLRAFGGHHDAGFGNLFALAEDIGDRALDIVALLLAQARGIDDGDGPAFLDGQRRNTGGKAVGKQRFGIGRTHGRGCCSIEKRAATPVFPPNRTYKEQHENF